MKKADYIINALGVTITVEKESVYFTRRRIDGSWIRVLSRVEHRTPCGVVLVAPYSDDNTLCLVATGGKTYTLSRLEEWVES